MGIGNATHRRGSWTGIVGAAVLLAMTAPLAAGAAAAGVKAWEQEVVIPTYLAGAPEPNPMFYFGPLLSKTRR